MLDRMSPHSIEAEQAVLGAVLISPDSWSIAVSLLTVDDFYRDAHKRIFAALSQLHARSVPADLLTLSEELKRTGEFDEVGGTSYLSSLLDGVPRSANVGYYADIVRQHRARRRAIEVATSLLSEAYDAERNAAEIVEDATRSLVGCVDVKSAGFVSSSVAVRQYAEALAGGSLGGAVHTGYADFDELTGGLRPQDLVYIAARPSSGKTSFALGLARHIAKTTNKIVPFFTLEMSVLKLAARMLAWDCGVPAQRLERGLATDQEYQRAAEASMRDVAPTLQLKDTARTVTEIMAWCKRARTDGELACVVIDYFQLLVPERKNSRRDVEVAYISESLKHLGKDLNVSIVALSQLSRAPEARRDKRPQMSDLRESGALEQDADLVLLLFREEMHKKREETAGIAECIVAKNRNGPVGNLKMQFDADLAMFRNLSRQQEL